MADQVLESTVKEHLLRASEVIESQLNAEIERLDNMDEDEMEKLRQKRLENLKQAAKQKQEWLSQGHGTYFEIANEAEFFAESKKSKNVVCHFYRDSTFRCKIVDKHLEILAPRHIETKFIKLNVEKCKFLVDRLRIKILPTICLVTEGKTIDYIVGFDDLGGIDEFTTEMLEWRLGRSSVINYKGDLLNPPNSDSRKKVLPIGHKEHKKIIRGRDDDSDDDDDD